MTSAAGRPRAAIRFHADAYELARPRLLGRHAANNGFLRAAVHGREGGAVAGYGVTPDLELPFGDAVRRIDATAETHWSPADHLERLAAHKVLHRHDPRIQREARLRLRVRADLFSVTGVTHTTFGVLPDLAALLHEPLTPWDALICTSNSVRETVRRVQEAEADYLRWRHGPETRLAAPQLPVIPLGVHTSDYEFAAGEREAARRRLGLAPEDVAVLFVGRLSLTTKTHPGQMYMGLQAAVERTGLSVTLIECGYFGTDADAEAFRSGSALLCPDVRARHVDGRDADGRRACWAAADVFVALSDNIQETFGLTPLEAMAAGLPAVVSDWDGYRETVRHGLDGFCIPTWAPGPGAGEHLARAFESGTLHEDLFSWAGAASTSVDMEVLVERLSALIASPDLRRQMGASGRERARSIYDWSGVYGQYRDLWAELDARRVAEGPAMAAPPMGGQLEPFTAFGHYASSQIGPESRATLTPGADLARFRRLAGHPLFPYQPAAERNVLPLLAVLEGGETTVAEAARLSDLSLRPVILTLGVLAKMGLVRLGTPT